MSKRTVTMDSPALKEFYPAKKAKKKKKKKKVLKKR